MHVAARSFSFYKNLQNLISFVFPLLFEVDFTDPFSRGLA
jgi:hypothetical protein